MTFIKPRAVQSEMTPFNALTTSAWLRTGFVVLWLMLFSGQSFAAVTAYVNRNPVALDESITLTVESEDGGDAPDFSVLKNDFDLMGQSSNSSIQIINGQMSRKHQWQVGLIAKRAGEIQIPEFSVGGAKSQPLTLTVVASKPAQDGQESNDLFMEVTATPQQPYVQQELLYTVKLYFGVNMADGNTLSEPKVTGGDAIVEKIGDNRQYQTTVNGRRYGVLEQQYAIYPQKSGPLTIEPLLFDGSVVEQQQRNRGLFFDPFNQTTRHVRLRSKEVKLTVQPMPAGVTGQWLPARSVTLQEYWSEDPPEFVVGEPITRTLAVMADGLTAAQLPEIGKELPAGLKSYPDQPQLKDTKDASGITGLRQQKMALIPTQPGEVTLPAIELAWWNVGKKRMEVARLPERTVTVAPGTGVAISSPATTLPESAAETVDQTAQTSVADVVNQITASTTAGWWPWLSLLLGGAWLVTLIAWWRQRRGPIVATEISTVTIDQQQLRLFEQQLKKGCQQNSAEQSKTALLGWAKTRWPQQPPASLPAIAALSAAPLAEAIAALDRALYAGGEVKWQGEPLWRLFEQHKPIGKTADKVKTAGLEPLYRM